MRFLSWGDVHEARERIAPFAHRTPVLTSSTIDAACGGTVLFKCENLQKTGSFKFRGASNAVVSLSPEERARGVYGHSSGNFAQALALAAKLHEIPAHIVMPENSNPSKVAATRGYGARVIFCPPTHEGRWTVAEQIGRETGAVFVHPHDDLVVIAGQGTGVCELIEESGDLDLVLVPVGGGGLLSGTLVAAKHLLPRARVVGCEPAGADDAARSLESGKRIVDFTPNTVADGLRTPLGENTFEIIRELVDEILVVPEDEILPAMRFVWERMKIVIEPSSAVAVAPLLSRSLDLRGLRVGVILSGGNVDLGGLFGARSS
ncbi:pyridoxal-phosphate dependent enzyme [Candidatus Bipolaricaulota bacterium]